jgi:hypothetical protein
VVAAAAEGVLDAAPVSYVPSGGSEDVPFSCVNHGVERMSTVLWHRDPGIVTLFAIGPLTDVACP